jgi:hypothetical protein
LKGQENLYPDQTNYDAYWDSSVSAVLFLDSNGHLLFSNQIPSTTRFFSIKFDDPISPNFDATNVAAVSVVNKAYELSQVIRQIAIITHVKDVIIVAHSLGGLVSRAYLENLASASNCYSLGNNEPDYNNGLCAPGKADAGFRDDVADLITLDATHSGAPIAELFLTPLGLAAPCWVPPTLNKNELLLQSQGGPGLVEALNYTIGFTIAGATPTDLTVPIQAIQSWYTDDPDPWTNYLVLGNGVLTGESDEIVSSQSQSIKLSVPAEHANAALSDLPNTFSIRDPTINSTGACYAPLLDVLHLADCVGAQPQTQFLLYTTVLPYTNGTLTSIAVNATLDGQPYSGQLSYSLAGPTPKSGTADETFFDVTPGEYTVQVNGGPTSNVTVTPSPTQSFGWNSSTKTNVWALTFTINFASAAIPPPVVITQPASQITTNGATFNGTVNPAGYPAGVWFERSTSSSFSPLQIVGQQTLAAGNTPVPVIFNQLGLASQSKYYYRIVANNGGVNQNGATVSFVTLAALASPTLLAPSNGSTGVTTTPTFSWSAVYGASYRIFVATSPSALPTSPGSTTCGCLLGASSTGTTYTPAAGTLSGGVTYYWEVSATVGGPLPLQAQTIFL